MLPTTADTNVSLLVPALAGLAGILVGAWLTSRRDSATRKSKYIERQLEEFYSPLLGLRKEISAHSELRVKIQDVASATWQELSIVAESVGQQNLAALTRERGEAFSKLIEYDNLKLTETLLPAYDKMLEIFRANFWLADPSTQRFYPTLVEFVDIWHRWKAEALPPEVLRKLDHTEDALHPFYAHVEQVHESLRTKLKEGKT